jgi:uncharacterized protein (TIGR02246 family)
VKGQVEQIKETIQRLETGWNHKNAYLWSSGFAETCDYIDVFGHFHKNWTREANADLHLKVWKSVYAKSHMRLLLEKIDFPTDHICIVIVKCELNYEINEESRTNQTVITCVLMRHGLEWFIRNFQNTAFRPY